MNLIYLATPYTHTDPAVRKLRFEFVSRAAAEIIKLGFLVISPISHTHPIVEFGGMAIGWETWGALDHEIIRRCDGIAVLKQPGWTQSVGIKAEVSLAERLGKPVVYLKPDLSNVMELKGIACTHDATS